MRTHGPLLAVAVFVLASACAHAGAPETAAAPKRRRPGSCIGLMQVSYALPKTAGIVDTIGPVHLWLAPSDWGRSSIEEMLREQAWEDGGTRVILRTPLAMYEGPPSEVPSVERTITRSIDGFIVRLPDEYERLPETCRRPSAKADSTRVASH